MQPCAEPGKSSIENLPTSHLDPFWIFSAVGNTAIICHNASPPATKAVGFIFNFRVGLAALSPSTARRLVAIYFGFPPGLRPFSACRHGASNSDFRHVTRNSTAPGRSQLEFNLRAPRESPSLHCHRRSGAGAADSCSRLRRRDGQSPAAFQPHQPRRGRLGLAGA